MEAGKASGLVRHLQIRQSASGGSARNQTAHIIISDSGPLRNFTTELPRVTSSNKTGASNHCLGGAAVKRNCHSGDGRWEHSKKRPRANNTDNDNNAAAAGEHTKHKSGQRSNATVTAVTGGVSASLRERHI